MDEKRFRLDFFIALGALLVSAVAAGASAYQTYVINQQFSATVWPYLSYTTTVDRGNGAFFQLDVKNSGLGPAIVRDSVVTVDGKPVRGGTTSNPLENAIEATLPQAIAAAKRARRHGAMQISTSEVARGDVVPAGTTITLLRAQGPGIVEQAEAERKHIDIAICYCSLLGRCWMQRFSDASNEPRDVRACPLPSKPPTSP